MKKKIMTLSLVAALAATAVIGGTLAYFTDTTEEKINTFTVGNVDITLDEPEWDQDDAVLIPGREIAKNPTITVEADSQRAYTFMKVKLSDDFAALLKTYAETKGYNLSNEDDRNALIEAWFVSEVSPKVMSVDLADKSLILGVLSPKDPGQSVTYFDAVTVPADVDQTMIKENGTYEIYITAYAIQAEGFEGVNGSKQADRLAAYEALFSTN